MVNINEEFEDYVMNGGGDRTSDQIAVLKAYNIVANSVSMENVFTITDAFEKMYNDLE